MATISNTPRPGYVWDATDNCWYPIGTGPHSHADYITSGSAINPNIVDAKGDIIAATAADTVARLAVGTDGQVLTANSSTATGLKWETSLTVAPQIIPQASLQYLRTPILAAVGQQTGALNTTYYSPVYLSGISFDRIVCRTGSGHTGTSTARLGIFNADNATGKPSTVYLDAGTVSCTGTNTEFTITISSTPPAGFYWLAINVQAATGTASFTSADAGQNAIAANVMNGISATNKYAYWSESGVTGAFATAGTVSISTNALVAALRIQ